MVFATFKNSLDRLESLLVDAIKNEIDISGESAKGIASNFQAKKKESCKLTLISNTQLIKKSTLALMEESSSESDKIRILKIMRLAEELEKLQKQGEAGKMMAVVDEIKNMLPSLAFRKIDKLVIDVGELPQDVSEEILADIREAQKCYNSQCYRSAVILCGRILETALHRKYYEVTGQDALEKSPGIGLGNLVAKLAEKNIQLDPALMQQIHLINQARIFSVHKKSQPFLPTKDQTHAIILYTTDILKKLF